MWKRVKWIAGIVVLAFAALQLTHLPHSNPPVLPGHDLFAANPPPSDIGMMLRAACYNCHSCETEWPWYSHFAPFAWRITVDVNNGRDALNFSEWPHDHPSWVRKRWRHIANLVEDREMPLPIYTWLHPSARLTAEQRARLVQWTRQASE